MLKPLITAIRTISRDQLHLSCMIEPFLYAKEFTFQTRFKHIFLVPLHLENNQTNKQTQKLQRQQQQPSAPRITEPDSSEYLLSHCHLCRNRPFSLVHFVNHVIILRTIGSLFCSLKRAHASMNMSACTLFNQQNKGPNLLSIST